MVWITTYALGISLLVCVCIQKLLQRSHAITAFQFYNNARKVISEFYPECLNMIHQDAIAQGIFKLRNNMKKYFGVSADNAFNIACINPQTDNSIDNAMATIRTLKNTLCPSQNITNQIVSDQTDRLWIPDYLNMIESIRSKESKITELTTINEGLKEKLGKRNRKPFIEKSRKSQNDVLKRARVMQDEIEPILDTEVGHAANMAELTRRLHKQAVQQHTTKLSKNPVIELKSTTTPVELENTSTSVDLELSTNTLVGLQNTNTLVDLQNCSTTPAELVIINSPVELENNSNM